MTEPAWIDGDPTMEAIAAAVWEQCQTDGSSTVVDDPRNIAAVAASVAVSPRVPAEPRHTVDSITSDEAARRAARRASIVNLLDRAGRGVLNVSEAELLRQQVGAEQRVAEGDIAKLHASLEFTEAAITRVRRLCELTIAVSVRAHAIEQALDTLDALTPQETL